MNASSCSRHRTSVTREQDIISCAADMRARQARARQPSGSPPPPVRRHPAADAAAAGDTMTIPADQTRILIGPGGATIKGIEQQTGASITVDQDGTVRISSTNVDNVRRTKEIIAGLLKGIEVGQTLQGRVVSIKEFGCFVSVMPGKDHLVHISELANGRVSRVEDVVQVGESIWVKCIGVDDSGRLRLSRRAAMKEREQGWGPSGA